MMGQCLLELPDNLLEQAKRIATQNNTSLNQILVDAITQGFNESLLEKWAKQADINACRAVLAKIPNNPVDILDKV